MDRVAQIVESKQALATATGTISSPVDEVWPFIGAIGAEKLFIPGVLKSALVEGYGVGSRRRIQVEQGTVYETIVDYQPHYRVAYEVEEGHPFPAKGIFGVVELEHRSQSATRITWSTYYDSVEPSKEGQLREFSDGMWKNAIKALAKLAES